MMLNIRGLKFNDPLHTQGASIQLSRLWFKDRGSASTGTSAQGVTIPEENTSSEEEYPPGRV